MSKLDLAAAQVTAAVAPCVAGRVASFRGSYGVPKVYYFWYSSAEFKSTHVVQLFSKGVQAGVLWYYTYIT